MDDNNSTDIKLEKPSVIINEGATIVKEFIGDFVSDEDESKTELALSEEGKKRLQSQYNIFTENHSPTEFDKTIVRKYYYFCDKMHEVYKKSSRTVTALKIISAIVFLVLTGIFIYAGNNSGDKMLWFSIWILLIFTNVTIFMVIDYFRDSIKNRVLPYLDDIETLDFPKGINDLEEDDEDNDEDEDE